MRDALAGRNSCDKPNDRLDYFQLLSAKRGGRKSLHGFAKTMREMHPQFPLEQQCSHSEERFQLVFARNAMEILNDQPDCRLQPSGRGLLILGETEDAVSRPVGILKSAYGDKLNVGPVTIRYRYERNVEEPHMGLRVSCPARYCDAVRSNLDARGARLLATETAFSLTVIRASARLAVLLGYSRFLTTLTEGHGKVAMWFSHYAPVTTPPPGGAAA